MKRQIKIVEDGKEIIFELNDSIAADSLYNQLPLEVEVSDYSNEEKIFYPNRSLDTSGTPLANAKAGTLAYFAPWGDVVMFYENFGPFSGLYELGHVISGGECIKSISKATYLIEKIS